MERMVSLDLDLYRDVLTPSYTLGVMSADGAFLGYTVEDTDRQLENGGIKLYGITAIPRGRYRVIVSLSYRFKKRLPEILDVPQFTGVRIHGANDANQLLGCVGLGSERTDDGVRNCAMVKQHLIEMIDAATDNKEEVWLEIH